MKDTKVKKLFAQIEKSKSIIAKERDKLRDIHDDLDILLSDLSEGDEYIKTGLRYISDGLDRFSETL